MMLTTTTTLPYLLLEAFCDIGDMSDCGFSF